MSSLVDPHRSSRRESALRPGHLHRPVQQADLRATGPGRRLHHPVDSTSYNLADFIFGLPSSVNLGNNFVANLRQHVHSLVRSGRLARHAEAHPEPRPALGIRHAAWDRDNNWSDFNPATNTMIPATGGSLYNRALVHPDCKDFGPRLGFAYNIDAKTGHPRRIRHQLRLLQSRGQRHRRHQRSASPLRRLHPDHAAGGPVPSTFLTTLNSFTHRHRQSGQLQSC